MVDPELAHEEFDDELSRKGNGEEIKDARKQSSLSSFSVVYDLDGDGQLDKLERKMRDMDEEKRGHLRNDQVYGILEDQERFMLKYLSMRRVLVVAAILIVILAVSSFATAFAAVMIAKDTKESDGKLVANGGEYEGKVLATQQAAETYYAPPYKGNSGTSRMRRMNDEDGNGSNPTVIASIANSMYSNCEEGKNIWLRVDCNDDDAGMESIDICHGFQSEINGSPNTYRFRNGLIHAVTVDCSDDDIESECQFHVADCENYPAVIPFEQVVYCPDGVDFDGNVQRFQSDGDNIPQTLGHLNTFVVKKSNRGQAEKYERAGCSTYDNTILSASSGWSHFRIDDRTKNNDDTSYNTGTVDGTDVNGTGVRVYVLDTGIQAGHPEFSDRVIAGRNFVDGKNDTITDDNNGHGTHVAGTVGGKTHGVAKGANLVPVKVLDDNGEGALSDILSGIEYVAEQVEKYPNIPAVVIMALSGEKNCILNDAVNTIANEAGVIVVTGAGNDGPTYDACNNSPASATKALTVGAIDELDALASMSSVGNCVDMYAPGVNIVSSGINSNDASMKSGTSMAAAHAAGAAALMMQRLNFTAQSSVDIKAMMVNHASDGKIPGTESVDLPVNNKLLYVGDYCASDSDCDDSDSGNVCGCDAVCSTDRSCPIKTAIAEDDDENCDNSNFQTISECCQTVRKNGQFPWYTGDAACTCLTCNGNGKKWSEECASYTLKECVLSDFNTEHPDYDNKNFVCSFES
eukprot:CAMPEP_0195305868 /NCGR_PEP_ID=MMETSP0707-20130614/36910_1 /TAXON_ID=33640 /ORGANISM="Asterionellopsis glacialis, Strain CCMP134" /LENGTH=745 /DNA_ID=CAMNT_0040370075 /DNA_START=86 /DNA_END=2323 /DNA_ORIENTATION=+